jgi:hypothetical protein
MNLTKVSSTVSFLTYLLAYDLTSEYLILLNFGFFINFSTNFYLGTKYSANFYCELKVSLIISTAYEFKIKIYDESYLPDRINFLINLSFSGVFNLW